MDGDPAKGEPCLPQSRRSLALVARYLPLRPPLTAGAAGESIPIRLFLAGFDLGPSMRDVNKKFSVRYYLNLVLVDEEVRLLMPFCTLFVAWAPALPSLSPAACLRTVATLSSRRLSCGAKLASSNQKSGLARQLRSFRLRFCRTGLAVSVNSP